MRTSSSLRRWSSLPLLALVLTAAACGGDDDADGAATTSSGATVSTTTAAGAAPAGAAFPRTVSSQLGDAAISAAPERVVALGWTDMDVAVALGVTPIAITEAPDVPGGTYPWLAAALGHEHPELIDVFTAGIPVERIAALEPDLILAVNQYVQDDYDALRAFAPVVSYLEDPWGEDWRDHARQVARGLGREAELDAVFADVDAAVAAAADANPDLDGATFTFSAYRDGVFDLIDRPDVPVVKFMEEFGMHLPDQIVDPSSPYSRAVSLENVELLDADVVIVWTPDPEAMAAEPVFAASAAAQEGRVVYIDDALAQALNSPTALSIPYTIEQLVPDLSAAVGGTG